jgi:hypothetical protein
MGSGFCSLSKAEGNTLMRNMKSNQRNVFEAPSPIHGIGVFAARSFREGDHIIAIDDSDVVPDDIPHDGLPTHCFDYIAGGKIACMKAGHYTNHSCDFTSYVKTVEGVRYRIARRDLAAGTEVTSHYSINSRGDHLWKCSCGTASCLGMIPADFFHLPSELQVAYLPLLDDWFVEENGGLIEAVIATLPSSRDRRYMG